MNIPPLFFLSRSKDKRRQNVTDVIINAFFVTYIRLRRPETLGPDSLVLAGLWQYFFQRHTSIFDTSGGDCLSVPQVCHVIPQEKQSREKLELQTIPNYISVSPNETTHWHSCIICPLLFKWHTFEIKLISSEDQVSRISDSYCMVAGHIPSSSQQLLVKHCFPAVNYS